MKRTLKALKAVLMDKITIEVMEETYNHETDRFEETYRTLKPLEAIRFLMVKE